MSLKIENIKSRIPAGEIFPNIEVSILRFDNKIESNFTEMIFLEIARVKNKEIIKNIQTESHSGIAIFSNIMITEVGIYNLKFSCLDMITTRKISIIPSRYLRIKSSLSKTTLIQNEPSELPVKLKLEDIYGNNLSSNTKVSISVRPENPNIQLFGEIIEYQVSTIKMGNQQLFVIDEKLAPKLNLELGNTYIFKIKEVISQGFFFNFSTKSDGTHHDGDIFNLGCNFIEGRLSLTIMKNTPTKLFYFCKQVSGMGTEINISQEVNTPEFTLIGSKSLSLQKMILPVLGKINIYFIATRQKKNEVESSLLVIDVIRRYYGEVDFYNYFNENFGRVMFSSIYTKKIQEINNHKFQPRVKNLVPWESGLSESKFLNYKKNNPQELDSLPVNVDNSKGGTVKSNYVFYPRIRNPLPSNFENTPVPIINNNIMGLTSGTLTNMNVKNAIQTGPKSYVVNDVLSLKDILKQKKVDNQPTSDSLKSEVVRVV